MKTTQTSSTTSSAKPTDESGAAAGDNAPRHLLTAGAFGLALLIGLTVVFRQNHWHFGPPQLILSIGWIGVLSTGFFLWRAGFSVADVAGYGLPIQETDSAVELDREKHSLLKAIKEIEFDREMGKLSAEDATDLTRLYRGKAIEIIRALEQLKDAGDLDEIDAEVRARLAAEEATERIRSQVKAKAKAKPDAKKIATKETTESGDDRKEIVS